MGRRLWVFVDLSFASTHYDGWYSNKMRGQRRKRAEEKIANGSAAIAEQECVDFPTFSGHQIWGGAIRCGGTLTPHHYSVCEADLVERFRSVPMATQLWLEAPRRTSEVPTIANGGGMYKLAVIVLLSAGIAAADEPKVLRNYMQPEVGYAYPAMPADTPLTRAEVIDWNRIFDLTKEQSSIILSMYESYVRDHRNPLFDRLMPRYLAKASEASKTLKASGMSSQEFDTVWQDTGRAANQLMIAALQVELQFIDSLVPVLTPVQVERLEVLRGHAKRRKCHSVVTTDRWVNLELRDLWGNLPASQVTDENRAVIMAKLSEYERELTSLLEQWSASQLDAGRKMHNLLSGSARGAPDSEDNDPARIWARPAKVIKRIRDLHLRFNQDLLATLPGDVASEVQRVCQIRFFPEIYPDAAHANIVQLFSRVANDDAVTADVRSTIGGLREFYEQRYAELCKRLERACNQWDDDVASGVGEARPQNLVAAIQPDLSQRRELSEDFLKRCEVVLGETPSSPPPGASRSEDAKK